MLDWVFGVSYKGLEIVIDYGEDFPGLFHEEWAKESQEFVARQVYISITDFSEDFAVPDGKLVWEMVVVSIGKRSQDMAMEIRVGIARIIEIIQRLSRQRKRESCG